MDRKSKLLALLVFGVVSGIYCLTLWQPERQVRLHQENFLRAVEKRNWDRLGRFVAEHYSDRWGHDKEFVLRESREVFRQFLFLTIRQEIGEVTLTGTKGNVRTRITIAGTGGPMAEFAKARTNALTSPFAFEWEQASWKPWDWRLVSFDHPELELPE
jgi:hypothetical protein